MLLSFKHQFIFIHVYKVAGTSVVAALEPFAHCPEKLFLNRLVHKLNRATGVNLSLPHYKLKLFPDHIRARELKHALPPRVFDGYFKFAFVRNPWDWQVSLYHYMLEVTSHPQHHLAKSFAAFDDYLDWRVSQEKRLQKDFLTDETGKFLVDFVGRFERLSDDFQHVCRLLNLTVQLPCLNQTGHRDYRSYYTTRTRNLVQTHFREDIDTFGYTFETERRRAG